MNYERIPGIWFLFSGTAYLFGLIVCIVLTAWSFGVGFALGGGLVLVNAWSAARKVKSLDFVDRSRSTASLLLGFYGRLILLGVSLYVLIRFVRVDPLGLVTGLSVVPAGLFLMLVMIFIANRSPEEV